MTILSAVQEAAIELNQEDVTSVFTAPSTFVKELRLQATRTAQDLLKYYDWQKLQKLATFTGNASDASFSLPADYDRMVKDTDVHSSSFSTAKFVKARDLSHWRDILDNGLSGTPGTWIMLGGTFQVVQGAADPMAAGETAKFYYVSNYIVATEAGQSATKTGFTADTDVFVLSERLLTLGMIWRWKKSKKKDYSEEMRDYEIALQQETGGDKGTRIVMVGTQRFPGNVATAYPKALG